MKKEKSQKKVQDLAVQVLALARDNILIHLRFFDTALMKLRLKEALGSNEILTDGNWIYYDPVFVLKEYQQDPKRITRSYLHILMHCIFCHSFQYHKMDTALWDLAADIAVEYTILDINLFSAALPQDAEMQQKLKVLKEEIGQLTAERIYRYFKKNPLTLEKYQELHSLFQRDIHTLWMPKEELTISLQQWKKISERVKADLKSFTKAKQGSESLQENLREATKEHYNYKEILQRFTVMGEDIGINQDEFDIVYYTYGLTQYGNLPLIEPLEYKETNKVKEFVIAIDTSASCRGEVIKSFLNQTYSILKETENFFQKINVHILQCDNSIQSDTKITNQEDFQRFLKYGKLQGFGATDFRPVFDYIEQLKQQGEFENLKGLIYFTDGYGIYPEKMPDYHVIFAFLEEDKQRQPVPPWSIKVILEENIDGYEY